MKMDPMNIIATTFLAIGIFFDLRFQKIFNKVNLSLLGFAIVLQASVFGWSGLTQALVGSLGAFVFFLPLVILRFIGGGDLKLMVAFGALVPYQASLSVMIWSLIWGAILGVIRSIISGQFGLLLSNTYKIASGQSNKQTLVLQKIPFTIPLMLAWLSYLSTLRLPAGWWQ